MDSSRVSAEPPKQVKWPLSLVVGLVSVAVLAGVIFIFRLSSGPAVAEKPMARPNALANSDDSCVTCHNTASPGIVHQYGSSTMAEAKVTCRNCHEVAKDYPGSVEHQGTYVLKAPTTATCRNCHQAEVAQFEQSRHGLPSYVAVAGSKELPPEMLDPVEHLALAFFSFGRSYGYLSPGIACLGTIGRRD